MLGAVLTILFNVGFVLAQVPIQESMTRYAPKGCKHNLLPRSIDTNAFTSSSGEVQVHDVFGLPSTVKRTIVQMTLTNPSLLTLQAEVHRETPTSLTVEVYQRGQAGKLTGRLLASQSLLGAGGDGTKAFLHGFLDASHKEVELVFELLSVEVGAKQVDTRVAEARCWPVRLDLSAVPSARAALHVPTVCPVASSLPPLPEASAEGAVITLEDKGLVLDPVPHADPHFTYLIEDASMSTYQALWNVILEVPTRLHRFVRFFLRTSFRFTSAPLQLVIELFELTDAPDGTALAPACRMGCLGGVPVFNGQMLDHAMPTGFRYRLWLLAMPLVEWSIVLADRSQQCLEFDFDYSIRFEERLTPFEVGPAAWLCEAARLPKQIVQILDPESTEKMDSFTELVAGRSIWIRDRFGFPPDEVADMEHRITLEVAEESIFRATTHHSDGVDVFVALMKYGSSERECQTMKHPGPVPRQTVFCILRPGTYTLTFFAEYPLGGLHPCSDFFAQVALRPVALGDAAQTAACISGASFMGNLEVERSAALATTPKWKAIKVPITFQAKPSTITVWSQTLQVTKEDAQKRLYLRMVVQSDYASTDMRFQVRFEGRYVADTQVTSHGYADMIGPLDPGAYTAELYYVAGVGMSEKLCSTSMVDFRLVSRSQYPDESEQWMCTSTRVPAPDLLVPQSDEQVLIDSEYVIPSTGLHTITIKVETQHLLRVKVSSSHASFRIELWDGARDVGSGSEDFEAAVAGGSYQLKLISTSEASGFGSSCPTFVLNLLIQPKNLLPWCPWSPKSTDRSAKAEAQRTGDHFGNVLLDLVPKHLTKELSYTPPVTLWMSPGMEKTFEMQVDVAVAVRLNLDIHPPFLPLEVTIRRKHESGFIEVPAATGQWTASRILLMQNDLPKGSYVIELKQPRAYHLSGVSQEDLETLCAHVAISAEVGVASKEAVNTLRAELLDLPELLAVQTLPLSLNLVGWLSSTKLPVVGTQVYHFHLDEEATTLKLPDKAIVRVVCEPADLSNAEIAANLVENGRPISQSDTLGQLLAEVPAGTYELQLKPKAKAPFLITVGVAMESALREGLATEDAGRPCSKDFPDLASGVSFSAAGWSIGPTLVRLESSFLRKQGLLKKVPITIVTASVLYIEVGSSLPLDLIRIALQVPEGLWVGEQRGLRNSLEIELPAGQYNVHIGQPKMSSLVTTDRCLSFSVYITATPLNPDMASDEKEAQDESAAEQTPARLPDGPIELAPREEASLESAPCFQMGTVPLPLDLSDENGGSQSIGGPLSKDGRLLVRTHALITDMHDGRKKIFFKTSSSTLLLKVAVTLGGYARLSLTNQLSFSVETIGQSTIEPVEVWATPEGWERVYLLNKFTDFWLTFHHAHRERSESACVNFGLFVEAHPVEDRPRMLSCTGSKISPKDLLPEEFEILHGDSAFTYLKPLSSLQQNQRGFLSIVQFTLHEESWVNCEVGFNFFNSHTEMDVVAQTDKKTSLLTSELDFLHEPGSKTNARLLLSGKLPQGEYLLRIADDHHSEQFAGAPSGCMPFSILFQAVPQSAPPTVLSVHPDPSVPIRRGTDLVLRVRFSEPPEGSDEDVLESIKLGGYTASMAASLSSMQGRWAASKRATVQAATADGHHLWVIGWHAELLALMTSAELTINLKSSVSHRPISFGGATFTFVELQAARASSDPWSGDAGNQASQPILNQEAPVRPAVDQVNERQDFATGEVHIEGGNQGLPRAPPPPPAHPEVWHQEIHGFDAPRVEEWHPEGSIRRERQERVAALHTDSQPSGYRAVTLGCILSLAGVAMVFYWPQLRSQPRHSRPNVRYKELEMNEEEGGLVGSTSRFDDDDDML